MWQRTATFVLVVSCFLISSTMMQPLQREDEDLLEDAEQSWVDEEQDALPLITAARNDAADSVSLRQRRQQRQRLKTLEIAMLAEEDETYYPSCLGDSWRLLASVILASLIAGPMLLRYFRATSPWPSDSLPCALRYGISYSETFKAMEEATDFCKEPGCTCTSPLVPKFAVSGPQEEIWERTMERNIELIKNDTMNNITPDVVMVGDSITEHWHGTGLLKMKHEDIKEVYEEIFRQPDGIKGLALGISGDRCPQLLYRLRNGEMPASLQPKVWWVLIGTNDLAGGSGGGWGGICSPESVLVGIINIAKEIQANKVNATIVLNSILPRPGDQDSGRLYGSLWEDISWINDRLECFAEGVDGIEFFNATDLFLVNDTHINETLLPDMLHPSAEGARVWGMEIVKKVEELSTIQT